ncbi:hypothetical protein OH76DRAFT_1183858 [Lentinus brumalis]|uniref:Uncharacterized protein n=1 Tax=Lentinus brumalis TaxID=2498619 RepID=A0A371CTZ5_9APHY|nr:hypothetical protein OH76DRAFT_1183858 [Polyporus brumalis]
MPRRPRPPARPSPSPSPRPPPSRTPSRPTRAPCPSLRPTRVPPRCHLPLRPQCRPSPATSRGMRLPVLCGWAWWDRSRTLHLVTQLVTWMYSCLDRTIPFICIVFHVFYDRRSTNPLSLRADDHVVADMILRSDVLESGKEPVHEREAGKLVHRGVHAGRAPPTA